MLRKTYNRDYIEFYRYFGYDAKQVSTEQKYGNSVFILDNQEIMHQLTWVWCHLSVLNTNALAICCGGYIKLEPNKLIIGQFDADGIFKLYIDLIHIYNKFKKIGIDKYDAEKILNLTYYTYATGSFCNTLYESSLGASYSFNVTDIPCTVFMNKVPNTNRNGLYLGTYDFNSNELSHVKPTDRLYLSGFAFYVNIVLHGVSDIFSMKYADSLKKKFKVFTLNNIKHLQNYYIN